MNTTTEINEKPITKREAVLLAFLEKGNFNRFEIYSKIGDSCLNSSISSLEHGSGILFRRVPESFKNRSGSTTRCNRYFLEGVYRDRAEKLVIDLKSRREGRS